MPIDGLIRLGRFVDFALRVILAAPVAIVRRPGEVLRQFERVAWGSLSLVSVAGLSIGLVSWLQTRRLLVRYGVEATLPSVLAAAVLVETGPMLASILVAARLGAGLAAELSSKVLTEEVDAAEVLGASAIPSLVAPRVVACALAVPLLTIVLDTAALLGGLAAELTGGSLSAQAYAERCLDYLRLADVVPGTLKTVIFGLIVGLVGCWVGLRSERSTEAIGSAATRGVVASVLLIFGANVLLVPLIQWGTAAVGWVG
ncbi:MlaE family ABC transporter permease [Tautonia marina]|uniref:MlaE family ABC transporter permease n=1 Tax=Tautonia marina TaxID=2653855 RepID=UPI001260C8B8|nr:ABC transporter permease [Tautonia marina]